MRRRLCHTAFENGSPQFMILVTLSIGKVGLFLWTKTASANLEILPVPCAAQGQTYFGIFPSSWMPLKKANSPNHLRTYKNSYLIKIIVNNLTYSRMRSEGLGVRLCSRKVAFVFATVCVTAVRLSTVASASGVVPKAYPVDSCRRSYIGVCRGGVCVSDLCRRNYFSVCRGGVCVSDLCLHNYFSICRGGIWVSDLCHHNYIGVCRGGDCVSDLCRYSCICVCRGYICVSDFCRHMAFAEGVFVRMLCIVVVISVFTKDLFYRNYFSVYRGGIYISDLYYRNYLGICRGGAYVSALCCRGYIGVCGGVLVFVICVGVIISVFVEEVFMWMFCIVVIIFVFLQRIYFVVVVLAFVGEIFIFVWLIFICVESIK